MKQKLIKIFSIISLLIVFINFNKIKTFGASFSTIPATGTSADSAIITDNSGQVMSHTKPLSAYEGYKVTWNFSIPNDQVIQSGDTTVFNLPSNVSVSQDINIPIYLDDNIIGYFRINPGDTTGVLTYNNYLQDNPEVNRYGCISIGVNGKQVTHDSSNFLINKVGWFNNNGQPTWNIALNLPAQHYDSLSIKDTMSNNQNFVNSSVEITTGYYNEQGQWVATGVLPASSYQIIKQGQTVIFVLHNVNSAINITYNTQVTVNSETELTNSVSTTINGKTYVNQADLAYGANGYINGERPINPSTPSSSSSFGSNPLTSSSGSSSSSSDSSSSISSSSSSSDSSSSISSSSSSSDSSSSISSSSSSSDSSSSISSSSSSSDSSSSISSSSSSSDSSSSISSSSSSSDSSSSISSSLSSSNSSSNKFKHSSSSKHMSSIKPTSVNVFSSINPSTNSSTSKNTLKQTNKCLPKTGIKYNNGLIILGFLCVTFAIAVIVKI